MKNDHQTEELNAAIQALEIRRKGELNEMKTQLRLTGQSLKPGNLIKSAISDITTSHHLKSYLIKAGIGLAIGLITKKLTQTRPRISEPQKKNNFFSEIADAGMKHLTTKKAAIIETAIPIVAGIIIKAIQNRKRKRSGE